MVCQDPARLSLPYSCYAAVETILQDSVADMSHTISFRHPDKTIEEHRTGYVRRALRFDSFVPYPVTSHT